MKKLLLAVLFLPTMGWAAYQPVSGSTVIVQGANNNTTAIPVSGTLGVSNSTIAVIQNGIWTVSNSTHAVNQNGLWTISNSTIAVIQTGAPWSTTVANSTHAVTQNGLWTVANSTIAVLGTLSDNGVAAGTDRLATLSGIYENNYNAGTAGTVGRNSAQSHGTDGLLWTASLPSFRPASYAASTNTITLASTASDISGICGNPTNTVLVYSVRASCTETTAGNVSVSIVKKSTKFTGAWSTMTAVAMDSTYAVMKSSAVWFTANPTPGTTVGHLDNYKMGCMAPATATANDIYISPASWRMKPIVLRGDAECLMVNLLSQTVTGGVFTVSYEWIETAVILP